MTDLPVMVVVSKARADQKGYKHEVRWEFQRHAAWCTLSDLTVESEGTERERFYKSSQVLWACSVGPEGAHMLRRSKRECAGNTNHVLHSLRHLATRRRRRRCRHRHSQREQRFDQSFWVRMTW